MRIDYEHIYLHFKTREERLQVVGSMLTALVELDQASPSEIVAAMLLTASEVMRQELWPNPTPEQENLINSLHDKVEEFLRKDPRWNSQNS